MNLTARQQRRLFWLLLSLTLAVMVVLQAFGTPLQTDAAPLGIVSYELAGDVATAAAILTSWDGEARIHAGFNLGLDYLFMLAYALTIALACLWGAAVLGQRWNLVGLAGVILAWLLGLAAILDAIENAALWHMLVRGAADPWPQIAFWCAAPKFAIVALGLVYALVAFLGWIALRFRRR